MRLLVLALLLLTTPAMAEVTAFAAIEHGSVRM
jgi:hypothetical protein